jgi:high-affinity nickel-transport protein
MMLSLLTGLVLGLTLGMRHALEPDHLAAVSVLIARHGNSQGGALLGAMWGVGHCLALFAVGVLVAVFDARLPAGLAQGFELLVAAMLLALGGRAVAGALRAVRVDGDQGSPGPGDGRPWSAARRPLIVGLIHGLAGSGALTALVVARLPTMTTRLAYIGLFGIGSLLGMAFLTGILGWPVTRLGRRGDLGRWLSGATGAFSLLLGAGWAWSAVRALLRA